MKNSLEPTTTIVISGVEKLALTIGIADNNPQFYETQLARKFLEQHLSTLSDPDAVKLRNVLAGETPIATKCEGRWQYWRLLASGLERINPSVQNWAVRRVETDARKLVLKRRTRWLIALNFSGFALLTLPCAAFGFEATIQSAFALTLCGLGIIGVTLTTTSLVLTRQHLTRLERDFGKTEQSAQLIAKSQSPPC